MESLFQSITLPIGKMGERAVIDYYTKKGIEIEDVSSIKEYQEKDIDCLFNKQSVEIKVGAKIPDYKEVCLEIVSNASPQRYRKGWFLTTEAEVIIYYSPKENRMYQFLTKDLRKYYNDNKNKIKHKETYVNEYGNILKPCLLAFIPIEGIENNICGFRTIEMGDNI